jgi:hypothetical protein
MKKDWEKSFQDFLEYASKEIRRAGKELKQEVQGLLENQEKLKKSLQGVADWAKAAAKEVAEAAQKHAQEAESKWSQTVQRGFCRFGKKKTSSGATWGEPVEKIRTEPPEAEKASEPKAKASKTSAPKAAKAKTTSKPRKPAAAAKKTPSKPVRKTKSK